METEETKKKKIKKKINTVVFFFKSNLLSIDAMRINTHTHTTTNES
jgi:hypothetical protein